jgi:hypothetical protein
MSGTSESIVVEKIKKLLALAKDNQNEHERKAAMRFVMDLLSRHNLKLAQIEDFKAGVKTQEVKGEFKLDPWIREVLQAACRLYYTDFYIASQWSPYTGRKENTPIFVGTQENITVTMTMATWLLESIRKQSNRAYKDEFERRSFRLGASQKVHERAIEMVKAEKTPAAPSTGTALMVVRNELERANQEHLSRLKLKQFKSRGIYLDRNAFASGEAYGERVKLERQAKTTKSINVRGRLPDLSRR